jgi:hypothetical protein
VTEWGTSGGLLTAGDRVVYVTGMGLAPSAHNLIVVHQVP